MELQLPHFENYDTFLSEPVINLLYQLEHILNDVDYNSHTDDITMQFFNHGFLSGAEKANILLSMYREHVDIVLAAQGVFLSEPFSIRLDYLVELLKGVCLLSTTPLSELLAFELIDTEDTNNVFFASIISNITNLSIHSVLENVNSITQTTVDYLKQNTPVPHQVIEHSLISKQRFMKWLEIIPNEGIAVYGIKVLNTFDYSPINFITAFYNELSEVSNNEMLANELLLIALGSHTPSSLLEVTTLELSKRLIEDMNKKLNVNGYLSKLFKKYELKNE